MILESSVKNKWVLFLKINKKNGIRIFESNTGNEKNGQIDIFFMETISTIKF